MPRVLASLMIGVCALAATSCAEAGGAPSAAAAPAPSAYVALGDSYSAAPLNPELADRPCLRSTGNYPSQLAQALSAPLTDVTCSGAKSEDVMSGQQLPGSRGGGALAPQIEAVGPETDLVTIGLGGNNGGLFTAIVNRCLAPDADDAGCVRALARSGGDEDFRATGEGIRSVVAEVRRRAADDVVIVLVDYPRLVTSARPCDALPGVDEESLAAVANAQRQLNRTLAAAAEDSGALFLDLEGPSEAHGLCSSDPWVNDSRTDPGLALRWHPFPPEQAAVAALLEQLLVG